jgi:DNA primase catalytic subunit
MTQIKVFDEILKLDPTQRKNVVRYFSKIRKADPFFSKYPPLPKLYTNIPKGIMLSKMTI